MVGARTIEIDLYFFHLRKQDSIFSSQSCPRTINDWAYQQYIVHILDKRELQLKGTAKDHITTDSFYRIKILNTTHSLQSKPRKQQYISLANKRSLIIYFDRADTIFSFLLYFFNHNCKFNNENNNEEKKKNEKQE